jgi:predicted Zn-dependent peptidase
LIETKSLGNGVTLLLEPIANSEVASVGFWFVHGSRDEKDDEQGYSHFLEHMLFKGTHARNAFQIASDIDRVGGVLNAFTEKEACCYYCTIPKEHTALAIDILSDMVFNSIIDEKDIENEKRVIINEIQSYMDSPEEVAFETFLTELWKRHPLATKITGEVEDVKKIERVKLLSFYRERYDCTNLVISVAGNISIQEVTDILARALEGKPRGSFTVERTKPSRNPSWKYGTNKFNQVQLYTGIDTLPYSGLRSFYTILVFSTIFGESISSRLYQEARERLGLCYSIYAFRSYYADTALWTIYANTTPDMAADLFKSIDNTIKSLFTSRITNKELSDAQSHLKGSLILTQEDTEVRMKRLYRLWSAHNTVLEFKDSMKMIDEVNIGELEEFAHLYLKPEDFNLYAYGSKKGKSIERMRFNFKK